MSRSDDFRRRFKVQFIQAVDRLAETSIQAYLVLYEYYASVLLPFVGRRIAAVDPDLVSLVPFLPTPWSAWDLPEVPPPRPTIVRFLEQFHRSFQDSLTAHTTYFAPLFHQDREVLLNPAEQQKYQDRYDVLRSPVWGPAVTPPIRRYHREYLSHYVTQHGQPPTACYDLKFLAYPALVRDEDLNTALAARSKQIQEFGARGDQHWRDKHPSRPELADLWKQRRRTNPKATAAPAPAPYRPALVARLRRPPMPSAPLASTNILIAVYPLFARIQPLLPCLHPRMH